MPITLPKRMEKDWRSASAFSEKVNDVTFERPHVKSIGRAVRLMFGVGIFWICLFLSLGQIVDLFHQDPTRPSLGSLPSAHNGDGGSTGSPVSKEAYVLFLLSVARTDYLSSVRLLLYDLKHDHETRDNHNRDVVVISTSQVPLSVEDQLRAEGAIILRDIQFTSTFPSHLDETADQRLQRDIDILLLWNLTRYDRVVWVDGGALLLKSIEGIWNDIVVQKLNGSADSPSPISDDQFQEGCLLVTTSSIVFAELSAIRRECVTCSATALLNRYLDKGSPRPWSILDSRWATSLSHGHAKYLQSSAALPSEGWRVLKNYKKGKMIGHQAIVEAFADKHEI